MLLLNISFMRLFFKPRRRRFQKARGKMRKENAGDLIRFYPAEIYT